MTLSATALLRALAARRIPDTLGAHVWYRPAVIGYGYDYGTNPNGIPAEIVRLTVRRVEIRFETRTGVPKTALTTPSCLRPREGA